MKKITLKATCLAMGLLLMASCKSVENGFASGNMPSDIQIVENVCGVKDVHLIHLDDYDFNKMLETNETKPLKFACTQVRKGDYVTRNLDWQQVDESTYIVHLKGNDKHLASLTVCGVNPDMKHAPLKELSAEEANNLLIHPTDGMNSAGVYAAMNVCPYGEMTETGDAEHSTIDYKAPADGVNADKPAVSVMLQTCVLMDHATSLEDAKSIIVGTNWKDIPEMNKMGFQFHWLVQTKDGGFVCEFVDNKPVFIDAKSTTSADYGNIMSNFGNYMKDKHDIIQKKGAGYERCEIISQMYDKAEGLEGAKDFARSVFYTNTYKKDYDEPLYCFTEYACEEVPAPTLYSFRDAKNRTGEKWDLFLNVYKEAKEQWKKQKSDYKPGDASNLWITGHTSIWNLVDKTLLLDIEEQDQYKIHLNLDGEEI